MSPGSGVKSEYMKRYREPRWEEYGPCYRELLHYRLGRRLLEQAHAPWLWDDWGPAGASDDSASSASSGAGGPAPQFAPASPPPPPAEPAAREGPERRARGPAEEQGAEAAEAGEARDAASAEEAADGALPDGECASQAEIRVVSAPPPPSRPYFRHLVALG
ncbi:centriole, cilia and spindle-associated protein isoform X5 [Neofelis nebulosa]|uniref:centriole, cilia and spindle-associated protein isoform X5 n=1 Tax=Neofelis nebulosa TaxID=61452 RepID=UPI00272B5252|nr:centriole, cilia and spindle-associated protein isoform X5 [Neofelis nebulosa]